MSEVVRMESNFGVSIDLVAIAEVKRSIGDGKICEEGGMRMNSSAHGGVPGGFAPLRVGPVKYYSINLRLLRIFGDSAPPNSCAGGGCARMPTLGVPCPFLQ